MMPGVQHKMKRRVRECCLAVALGTTGVAMVMPLTAAAQTDARKHYDLATQPLGTALEKFADIAGVQLAYSTDLARGLTSPVLSGDYTPDEALQHLLSGTGLKFRFSGNTVTIDRFDGKGAKVLSPVQVEGVQTAGANGSTDVTATEGTGSYTTNAMTIGSKAPLSIRETPQSVSVVTQQRMQDQNLTDLNSALNYAPGVTLISASDGITQKFYSRGFQISNFQFDGGSAANMNFSVQPQFDMAEYDHVELLRGADGMFAGAGDPGGTVNLVRKRPLDHDQILLEGDAGSWNNYRATVDVTGPLKIADLGDRLRGRLVMTYQSQDYFYKTVSNNHILVYGVIEADITPTTLLTVGGSFTRYDEVPWVNGLPRYQNGDDLRLPRSTSFAFPWSRADYTTPEMFVRMEQKIGEDWSAKLNLTDLGQGRNYRSGYISGAVNPNTLTGPTLGAQQLLYPNSSYMADVTVTGNYELFGRQHQLAVGANYQETNSDGELGYPAPSLAACPQVDIFQFDAAACPEPASGLPNAYYPANGVKQWGGYATLRFQILDDLHLLSGLRFSGLESVSDKVGINSGASQNTPPCNCELHSKYGESGVITPYAALSYDFTSVWSMYASYTDIFKVQANNLQGPPPGTPLQPVRGGEYEAGVKGELLDGALNTSLSLYRINQKNAAISDPNYPFTTGVNNTHCCYLGATNIESEGVDLEVAGQILPGWQISAGYTYNYNFTVYAGPGPANGQVYTTQSPKHLFKLWTTYQLPDDWKQWTLGFGVNAQSSGYYSGSVCPIANITSTGGCSVTQVPYHFIQGGYGVFSGRIAYQFDEHWQASVNVNNILDKTYYQTVGSSSSGNYYGDPRNFMFTIRFLN